MKELGFEFEVVPSGFEEDNSKYSDPYQLVQDFSVQKAGEVLNRFPEAIVIGSDVVGLNADGEILSKPKDRDDAYRIIKSIQGRWVKVIAGLAVLQGDDIQVGFEEATVYFKPMTDEDIAGYVDAPDADWHGSAGAFKIKGKAGEWIEKVEGRVDVVQGFPVELLDRFLQA